MTIIDLKFGDLLSDEESFRSFLSNDLHLEEPVIDDALNATVNTNLVYNYYKRVCINL